MADGPVWPDTTGSRPLFYLPHPNDNDPVWSRDSQPKEQQA